MPGVALATDMMGLGFSAPQASLMGDTIATTAGVGTAQVGAAPITASITLATTAASQTALVLPATAPLASEYFVTCTTATSALVFPPVGGAIDGGSTNASVTIAQGKSRSFLRVSNTAWISLAGA